MDSSMLQYCKFIKCGACKKTQPSGGNFNVMSQAAVDVFCIEILFKEIIACRHVAVCTCAFSHSLVRF